MISFLSAIPQWIVFILIIDVLIVMAGYILIYWIRPLCPPGWWERNVAAIHPFDIEADRQIGSVA